MARSSETPSSRQHWLKAVREAAAFPDYREGLAAFEQELAGSDYGSENEHSKDKAWGNFIKGTLLLNVVAVQGEPRETAIAPENFLPELERVLGRHIREIEKHIPKDPSGDLEGV